MPDSFEADLDKYDHTELYYARESFVQDLTDRKNVGRRDDETLSEFYIRTFKSTLRMARRDVQHRGLTIPPRDRPGAKRIPEEEIGDVKGPQEAKKTNWDRMLTPYMADQREVTTMVVIPAAEGLRDDLNELASMYDLDGRTIMRICTMTTKGMNSFLNDFTPKGVGDTEINKKAMYMARCMINQAETDNLSLNHI